MSTNGTAIHEDPLYERVTHEAARAAREAAKEEVSVMRGVLDRVARHVGYADENSAAALDIVRQVRADQLKDQLKAAQRHAENGADLADLKAALMVEIGKIGAADQEQDQRIAEAQTKADEARALAVLSKKEAEVGSPRDMAELLRFRQSGADLLIERARVSQANAAEKDKIRRTFFAAVSESAGKSVSYLLFAAAIIAGSYLAARFGQPAPVNPTTIIQQESPK